jgi:hypothetical protein
MAEVNAVGGTKGARRAPSGGDLGEAEVMVDECGLGRPTMPVTPCPRVFQGSGCRRASLFLLIPPGEPCAYDLLLRLDRFSACAF